MNSTECRWRADFANTAEAIPALWLGTDNDGWTGIHPDYRHTSVVELYHSLMCVGAARGWL